MTASPFPWQGSMMMMITMHGQECRTCMFADERPRHAAVRVDDAGFGSPPSATKPTWRQNIRSLSISTCKNSTPRQIAPANGLYGYHAHACARLPAPRFQHGTAVGVQRCGRGGPCARQAAPRQGRSATKASRWIPHHNAAGNSSSSDIFNVKRSRACTPSVVKNGQQSHAPGSTMFEAPSSRRQRAARSRQVRQRRAESEVNARPGMIMIVENWSPRPLTTPRRAWARVRACARDADDGQNEQQAGSTIARADQLVDH